MKRFLKIGGISALVAALILTVLTGVSTLFFDGQTTLLSNIVGTVTMPLKRGVAAVAGWIGDTYSYAYQYNALRAENEKLKDQIADLESQAREGEASSRENERLRKLLGLQEKRRDFVFESATIVSRNSSNWESTLTLSKGTGAGIKEGDCVVTESGSLVGVVAEAGNNWSTVVSVLDAEIQMGGKIFRTEQPAVIEGDFALMLEGKLKVTYLPRNADILTGDLILTSGAGGVYPSELVVGTVTETQIDPSGMSSYAILTPDADLEQLTQVFVIKAFDIIE